MSVARNATARSNSNKKVAQYKFRCWNQAFTDALNYVLSARIQFVLNVVIKGCSGEVDSILPYTYPILSLSVSWTYHISCHVIIISYRIAKSYDMIPYHISCITSRTIILYHHHHYSILHLHASISLQSCSLSTIVIFVWSVYRPFYINIFPVCPYKMHTHLLCFLCYIILLADSKYLLSIYTFSRVISLRYGNCRILPEPGTWVNKKFPC